MTWLAVADHKAQRFSARGLGLDRQRDIICDNTPGAILTRGTVMVETAITGEDRPEVLLGLSRSGPPATRSFWIKSVPGGGVTLVATMGGQIRHAAIQHGGEGRMDVLRISYAWDNASGWARLALERPGGLNVFSTTVEDPLPMLMTDLHALMMTPQDMSPNVVFAALSSEIEPLGPSPSLMPNLEVTTADEPIPVSDLKRGDTILCDDTDSVPVLYPVRRRVPAKGSFRPVRLRAPYFGLQRDVIVAPTQRLILTGSLVEYTYARPAVLVPAGHLVNGTAARFEPCGPVIEYAQVLMPRHEGLEVHGCRLESLYIGRLRRRPDQLDASLLARLPRANLPEHARPLHPVLGAFEAITLAAQRAA